MPVAIDRWTIQPSRHVYAEEYSFSTRRVSDVPIVTVIGGPNESRHIEPPQGASLARSAITILASNIVSNLLGGIRAFYIARTLAPSEYGAWTLLSALLSYANYADVGVNTGYIVEVPRLIGERRHGEAAAVEREAYSVTLVVLGAVAILLVVASMTNFQFAERHTKELRIGALGAVVFGLANFYQVVGRLRNFWGHIGVATICGSATATVGVIALGVTGRLDAAGAAILTVAGSLVFAVLLATVGKTRPVWPINLSVAVRLAGVGVPIVGIPLVFTLFQNVDRWIVAAVVPAAELGHYGFGAMLGAFLYMVPNALATVLFTRQIEADGASDQALAVALVLPPIQAIGYIMAVIAGALIVALPFVLLHLAPAFYPSRVVVVLQLVAYCLLFAVPIASGYLISIQSRDRVLFALAAAILIEVVGVTVLVRSEFGIVGAAWSVLLANIVYSVLLSYMCVRSTANAAARTVALYFSPFVPCVTCALLVASAAGPRGEIWSDLITMLLQEIGYCSCAGALCLGLSKATGFIPVPFVVNRLGRLPAPLATLLTRMISR